MLVVCFGIRCVLDIDQVVIALENMANTISMNKEYFINVASIIVQMAFGALTYFVTLIILKDDYVFKFIDKIKTKIFKKKEVETQN